MGSKTATAGGLMRQARDQAGLSQAQLAAQAGVTQSVISASTFSSSQGAIPAGYG